MSTTTRIQNKGQVTIPTRMHGQAGLSNGDLVEFSFRRRKIVITPNLTVDRSQFSNADDEYTPEQRRAIDARLDKSAKDFKTGRSYGPFDTADEAVRFLRKEIKARKVKQKPR